MEDQIGIRRWHIPICGFTQSLDGPSGMDRLWRKLRPLASEQTSLIPPQRWRADWSALAEFIARHHPSVGVPDVRVYAYSWGCGHGFASLARQLGRRGIPIRFAVLSDPVYHSWCRPWRAMIFSPAIKIPTNVREVYWFRQRQNRPRAADLFAADPQGTKIHQPVLLHRNHEYMDDAPGFHALCLEVASR